jgi:hypothetical protein
MIRRVKDYKNVNKKEYINGSVNNIPIFQRLTFLLKCKVDRRSHARYHQYDYHEKVPIFFDFIPWIYQALFLYAMFLVVVLIFFMRLRTIENFAN